ncbi:MAG TPA: formylmethanofuran--tetrahydromethanopterin N-formyltransferase [Methylomirabilota bacterium]|nr:formylmethanofuran--tetrahydromethanopterin N-formyltransferase [Methylomirabilota bacterium]
MADLRLRGVVIEDTFAEAFGMWAARAVVTAETPAWARTAGLAATGYATSVIGCDAEAGIEAALPPEATPDGRPGVSLLFFGFSQEGLAKALVNRLGQCVMTCATTACFDGLPAGEARVKVGGLLRFFGDGHQSSKKLGPRRYWRVPVMDGEFLCEERFAVTRAVAGGNFVVLGVDQAAALAAAEAAVAAIGRVPGVILPFPGGVVRSGSKVGSRYKKLRASTNDAYCPTLSALTRTALPPGVNAVYELVIDGLDLPAVEAATRAGVEAACRDGVVRISACNYGGKLGKYQIHLHRALTGAAAAASA